MSIFAIEFTQIKHKSVMSTILELLSKINNPICLDKINWREELRGFDVNRIASIIIGIEDDYVCEQVARIIEVADYPEYFSSPRCAAYEKDDERILPYYLELFKRAGLHNAKSVSEAIGISMKLRQGEKEKREKIKRISEETRARCCTQKEAERKTAPKAGKEPATKIAAGQPAETAEGFRSCILQKGAEERLLATLHSLMDGKTGKPAVLVLRCASQLGLITMPTHQQALSEFPGIGASSGYYKYHEFPFNDSETSPVNIAIQEMMEEE